MTLRHVKALAATQRFAEQIAVGGQPLGKRCQLLGRELTKICWAKLSEQPGQVTSWLKLTKLEPRHGRCEIPCQRLTERLRQRRLHGIKRCRRPLGRSHVLHKLLHGGSCLLLERAGRLQARMLIPLLSRPLGQLFDSTVDFIGRMLVDQLGGLQFLDPLLHHSGIGWLLDRVRARRPRTSDRHPG